MEERIKQIMSNTFQIEIKDITNDSNQDDFDQWDSIGHLNLITSLEEEFDILFSEEDIIEMLNFRLILEITKEAIKNK